MNSKSNEFKFNKSVEIFDKWGCSSVRESNRLKSDVSGADACESLQPLNSNLLNPTVFLNTKDIKFSHDDYKRKIKLPKVLDVLLAEDIGIQIGDGSLSRNYVVGCYGNITEDREYLKNVVIPLKNKLFNIKLRLLNHPIGGTCYIKFESKAIFTFYQKIIGLKTGIKNDIYIPKTIVEAPLEIKLACIKGIADTDFSLSFKRNFKGIHTDPYISLGCASRTLVIQISEIIKELKINSTLILDQKDFDKRTGQTYVKHYINIHGKKNLAKWMSFIGFHNPVQITKYLIWQKFGFCPPHTIFYKRLSLLNGRNQLDILKY